MNRIYLCHDLQIAISRLMLSFVEFYLFKGIRFREALIKKIKFVENSLEKTSTLDRKVDEIMNTIQGKFPIVIISHTIYQTT